MTSQPAWQRLGLKLKSTNGNSAAIGHPNTDTQPLDGHSTSTNTSSHKKKRKLDEPSSTALTSTPIKSPASSKTIQNASSVKRQRTGEDQTATVRTPSQVPTLTKKKSVTFGETPTKNSGVKAVDNDKKTTPAKSKSKGKTSDQKQDKTQQQASPGPTKKQKQQKQQTKSNLNPALEYLRHWGISRDSWKFNKNHQSTLIKHIFDLSDTNKIPAAEVEIFYQYIRDIKGYTRTRLREMALEIRLKDQKDGVSAFPAGLKDVEQKQQRYESIIAEYWTSPQARKRKSFSETDFLDSSDDEDPVIKRVIKRLRAEMIIDELSDGEQTDVSTTSTTTAASSSATIANKGVGQQNSTDLDGGKKLKLNDGSGKRRRKLRTMNDDSSDSDLSSDSESDTSSSSSGSSDDSDSETEDAGKKAGYDSDSTSSSSSSSSSSSEDEDSDSGSESDDEEEEET